MQHHRMAISTPTPTFDSNPDTPEIPIAKLGTWYAEQTGDRSLCVKQDDGSEYCTCVYQCGNGVWQELEEHGGSKSSGKEVDDEGREKERQDAHEERGDAGEYARYAYWIQKGLGVKSGKWKYEVGCKKYCHAGVCDGQD